jgi:diacylglycerol kinase family enzyme/membrane-associated phospholipid phosphatase
MPEQVLSSIRTTGHSRGRDRGKPRGLGLRARIRALAPGPVRRADLAAFRAVARTEIPVAGAALPVLSRAANRSGLWLALAGGLAMLAGRQGRRAAVRGILSIAATSALTNLPAKHLIARVRPEVALTPEVRRLARVPSSTSFPSGHAASAMAFATAVSLELPRLRVLLGGLAAAVGFSRVYTGVHYPADVLVGAAIGTAVARSSTRFWPVENPPPAAADTVDAVTASSDGAGLIVVANVEAGNAFSSWRTDRLRVLLPAVEIREVDPSEDLEAALARAAASADVLGVAGGDGTASAAARIAAEAGVPLALVPTGTLNHLAADLGIEDVHTAARAVREGRTIAMDLGDLNGRAFVDAVGLGGYQEMVAERERREGYLGKWPALAWAVISFVTRGVPLELEINGRRRRVWSLFLGSGRFVGDALVPARRYRLDDGCVEVRLIDAERSWSRLRLLSAAMVGQVARSQVYERWSAEHVVLRSHDGPIGVVCDGEVLPGASELTVGIRPRALRVLQPTPDEG